MKTDGRCPPPAAGLRRSSVDHLYNRSVTIKIKMFGYFSRKINVIQTRGISTILHDFIYSLLLCSAACTQLQRYSRTLHFAPVFTLPVLSGNFSATFFLSCSTVIFIIFSSVSQRSIIFISPSIPKTLTW